MLEITEGLPIAAVQRPVADTQQLGCPLHVHLLVFNSLKFMNVIHIWYVVSI